LTRFIPAKESKELRIMAISHNREIQSSSTTDSNVAPTCESIDQLTCPLSIALVVSAARNRPSQKKHLLPTQLWTSADEGKQCGASHRHKLPNAVASRVRQAVSLPAQGLVKAPHPLRVQRTQEISVLDVSSKPRRSR
jgi:hypothetical protein